MATRHKFDKDDLRRIAHDAMQERGLLPDFSSAVVAETNRIAGAATASGSEIRDLRNLDWVSIDNDDSRDLDQLTVAQPLDAGPVRILVAIADVDALVKKDSAIDGHAWTNTTSVYTPAGIFPMLPERLSTDLTSLGEGEERLAVVIDMTIAADGTLEGSEIYRALVLNHAKLAYNGVAAWLEGTGPAPPKLAAASRAGGADHASGQGRAITAAPSLGARRAAPGNARSPSRVRRRRDSPTCGPTRRTARRN